MSLALERLGTNPQGLLVKTWGKTMIDMEDIVQLGNYEISFEDFLIAAHYVLTNTDLYHNDPRMDFVESIKAMQRVPGFNRGHQRFYTPLSPVGRSC